MRRASRWYALCVDRARYVGEAVAAVVAEDRFTAYAALDLIDVDYEELPVVADPERAMEDGAPLVEPDWGDNIMASRDIVLGDPDAASRRPTASSPGTSAPPASPAPRSSRAGCLATYDPYEDTLTFWDSTQNPHPLRNYLAETLGMPDTSIRVIQPHVGGGFGLKIPTFQEEPLVAYLARKLKRPVKWIEERSENFWTGGHARDTRFHYEAAYKDDGTVTGIRLKVIADVGAPTALCGWGMSFVTWYCLPCVYKIPNSETHLRSVVTNKCPWNAYRGYGKDAASFLMDRIMDHIAQETRIDRVEVRFRNFIPPDEFPFPQVSGAMIDSGDYAKALSTRARDDRLRGVPGPAGAGAGRGPAPRARDRSGVDPRGLLDAGLAAPERLRRYGGAGQPDRRGDGLDRGDVARERKRDRDRADRRGRRSAARSTGSGSSRATPRHARGASATTARGA